ncbi:hypothetical protein SLEP1_g18769 [Rubroshorea leprosula]|uniref:Uncharacterized protein n=1 Tax=Rubroshorea leprosula TaxID=152421 RepID=A0AAV5IYM2_9ROSI|nr:hypothetical protein SLEP1_g18769 [Rubroshorea leprosula]
MVLKASDHVRKNITRPSKFVANWDSPFIVVEAHDSRCSFSWLSDPKYALANFSLSSNLKTSSFVSAKDFSIFSTCFACSLICLSKFLDVSFPTKPNSTLPRYAFARVNKCAQMAPTLKLCSQLHQWHPYTKKRSLHSFQQKGLPPCVAWLHKASGALKLAHQSDMLVSIKLNQAGNTSISLFISSKFLSSLTAKSLASLDLAEIEDG